MDAIVSIAAYARITWARGKKHLQKRRAAWFLGSDHNFAAQRSGAPAGRAASAGNLCSDPENARFRIALFLISAPGSLMSSGAALSPRRATHFSLLRQRKVSKRKATLLSASLRFAAGNLRCSVQPGSRSTSPSAQTIAGPDPSETPLPGADRRGLKSEIRDRFGEHRTELFFLWLRLLADGALHGPR